MTGELKDEITLAAKLGKTEYKSVGGKLYSVGADGSINSVDLKDKGSDPKSPDNVAYTRSINKTFPGLDIPEGVYTKSELDKNILKQKVSYGRTEAKREGIELQKKKELNRIYKDQYQKREKEELSTKEIDKFVSFKDMIDKGTIVRDLLVGDKRPTTGPFANAFQNMMEYAGGSPTKFAEARARMFGLISDEVKRRSGLTVSDAEFARLEQILPNTKQPLSTLKTNLEAYMDNIGREFETYATATGTAKYDAIPLYDAFVSGRGSKDLLKKLRTKAKDWESGLEKYEQEYRSLVKQEGLETPETKPAVEPTPAPKANIRVRRKSDGKVITMDSERAKRYLADPKFEEVQ